MTSSPYTPHTVWIGRKPVLNAFTMTAQGLGIKSIRVSKKDATRVNQHASVASYIPNSVKAPR